MINRQRILERLNCHRARWLILGAIPGTWCGNYLCGTGITRQEFLPVARSLDWAEVRLRGLAQQAKAIWTRSSIPMKILITLIILGCAAAIENGAYHLLFIDRCINSFP
jgi:hypothetical protein